MTPPPTAIPPTRSGPQAELPAPAPQAALPGPASQAALPAPPADPAAAAPRQGSGWVWFLVLCTLGAGGYFATPYVRPRLEPWIQSWTGKGQGPAKGPPVREIPVVTANVREGDMDLYLNGLGTVTAFYTVTLRSRVDGELLKVHFSEGQMVQQGDLLAEIDPRPYQVQLDEAEGQLAKDRAALEVAKLDLKRYSSLRSGGTITQQELDAQNALVKQSQATLAVDQAQVDNANLQLTYSRITAPLSGRIGLRMVDPGNMVKANDATGLATITQLQPIALVFTVPQDDIVRVQQSMQSRKKLEVEAWDRDMQNKLGTGVLSAIDNQVDQTTGTLRLKAIFDNKDEMLFPNQFVNARLLVATKYNAVIIPAAAVQRGPDSTFVYVVKDDSTVELRKIALGPAEGNETSVESGLSPREVVVTDGIDKLQPGSKVALREKTSVGGPGIKSAQRIPEKTP